LLNPSSALLGRQDPAQLKFLLDFLGAAERQFHLASWQEIASGNTGLTFYPLCGLLFFPEAICYKLMKTFGI